jgi:hypothetical protein
MANFFTRIVLFLSSYAPLFGVFAVRQYSHSHKATYIFCGLAIFSLFVLFIFFKTARTLAPTEIFVKEHGARDGDSMSYIVTYLVPFLDIKFDEFANVIGVAIIFLVLGVLYVNSNMIYTNPVLNVVGFHIFDIRTTEDRPMVIITRRSFLQSNAQLQIVLLGDYVGLEVRP